MAELNDFLTLIAEAKKEAKNEIEENSAENFIETVDEKIKLKKPTLNFSLNLNDTSFLSLIESEMIKSKEIEKEEQTKEKVFESFFDSIPVSLNNPVVKEELIVPETFEQLEEKQLQEIVEVFQVEESVEEILIEETPEYIVESPKKVDLTDPSHYDKLFKTNTDHFSQPDLPKVDPNIKALTDKIKYMEDWLTKISLAGPGGGEVNLRYLDDVYRPSIYDGRYLRYNDTLKKFEFAEVNPHDIVFTTNLIETPTYTVNDQDYYLGVNYAGPVTITLPLTPSSGRMIIIKDESGNAETNPITVHGNVDNDAGGFIIQINNGAIQLIYRNGWRIV